MATATATRTKRAQVQAAPIFRSTDDVNEALRQLCDISTRVSEREAEMQRAITEIKDECVSDLAEDLAMRAQHERNVEEYCTYYRTEVFPKNSKTLELPHGKVDFRAHPPAVIVSKKLRMTIPAVIDKIREVFGIKADSYLRVKEELNKDTLVTLEEPQLFVLGLEIQRKETFGITLNLETIAPASTQGNRIAN